MSSYRVPGYEGICRECFWPVSTGEGIRLREGGLLFHKKCVDEYPDGFYIRQEIETQALVSNADQSNDTRA